MVIYSLVASVFKDSCISESISTCVFIAAINAFQFTSMIAVQGTEVSAFLICALAVPFKSSLDFSPYSELIFHILLQKFFFVQFVIPAPFSVGCGVGDALSVTSPLHLIALGFHQAYKMFSRSCDCHGILNRNDQPHLPTLPALGRVIFSCRHLLHLLRFILRHDNRQVVFHTQLVRGISQALDVIAVRMIFISGITAHTVDNKV